ncbi:FecR family protein [Sphingobium yanoikuyae]|jgi:transmembrane sensor|uniref:FecR family protein n=1 Tax=Sphingobium yanoikuyae TaxID=13690 RepID=UPI003B90AF2A
MSEPGNNMEINRIAADWAAREDLRPLHQDEEGELESWLQLDPRHLGAYGRAKAILLRAQAVQADRSKAPDPSLPPAPQEAPLTAVPEDYAIVSARMARRRLLLSGLAASVAAVVGGSVWLRGRGGLEADQLYRTARGEIRTIPLEDGSVLTLNTASAVRVAFRPEERGIELIEGEAFFQVARDRARPFTVRNAERAVRAIGTAFSVRAFDDAVQVLVQEGRIRFSPSRPGAEAQAQALYADANMEIVDRLGQGKPLVRTMSPSDLAQSLAWLDATLSFNETSLQQAALEFRRYSSTPILLAPGLDHMSITGRFSSNDPVGFAEAVAQVLDLKVERSAQGIKLSPHEGR